MSILQLHQQRAQNRQTSVPRPGGIDPATIAKERENRLVEVFMTLFNLHSLAASPTVSASASLS